MSARCDCLRSLTGRVTAPSVIGELTQSLDYSAGSRRRGPLREIYRPGHYAVSDRVGHKPALYGSDAEEASY